MIARLDIKIAFRLLPIHPSDFELLGYKICENYFVDKCLPFGCSISCSLFEKFSTFLEWELIFNRASATSLADFDLKGTASGHYEKKSSTVRMLLCPDFDLGICIKSIQIWCHVLIIGIGWSSSTVFLNTPHV